MKVSTMKTKWHQGFHILNRGGVILSSSRFDTKGDPLLGVSIAHQYSISNGQLLSSLNIMVQDKMEVDGCVKSTVSKRA